MALSDRESNSFSTSRTSLVIGCFKIWLGPPFLSATQSVTLTTSFLHQYQYWQFLPLATDSDDNHVSAKQYHQLQSFESSFSISALLVCRLWRNSFLHLFQNYPAKCCTHCHLLFEYASGLLNLPGEGMTTLVFIVRRLLDGISLFDSLMVSTVSGLKLMISWTSAINVLSDSSFKEWLWTFNNPSKIVLADQTWRSQTPPIWEAPGGLLCHRIQCAPFSCKDALGLIMFHLFQCSL